jgi:profilin
MFLSSFFFFNIAYTDNIVGSGLFDKAAIYSADGAGVWANTGNLTLQPNEIQEIVAGFADASQVQMKGFHIEGVKQFCIRADSRSIYGKHELEGVMCVKTKQAIIIAHYPTGVVAGNAANVIEKMGDYLISVGY